MTSSRYRENVATIFDVFCEIGAATSGELPPLLTKYPDDFNDASVLKSIQQFALPYDLKKYKSEAVQLFSFVLTDSESKYSYGFCRYTPKNGSCICILSGFFWPNFFNAALNEISLLMSPESRTSMDIMLTRIYHTDIPNPGDVIRMIDPNYKIKAKIPDLTKLPSLRENKYMLEFYNAVSPRQLIAIYSSLLKERRIIITGMKLSQLSSCIHACSTLLFPMCWQSVFIPVLPESLFDMIMAPMPYLIGVPKPVLEANNLKDIGDVVVVDIDKKTLESHIDDVNAMPNEVVAYLKSQLKGTIDINDSFSRIFLHANVILFGKYRSGFVLDEQGKTKWSTEQFLAEQKPSLQAYLSSLLGADGVQYLERFIHDRVEAENKKKFVHSQFEEEIAEVRKREIPGSGFHQAVFDSLLGKSNGVIDVIKDKVSGIEISNKLNRLTPKEIRKAATRKKMNGSDEPTFSFENLHWEVSRGYESNDSPINCFNPNELPEYKEIPTANLIDFDSPVKDEINFMELKHSPNDFDKKIQRMEISNDAKKFSDPFSEMNSPVLNQPSSSTSSSTGLPNQSSFKTFSLSHWEKFE